MAFEVVLPQLGLNMESGVIVEWYKRDGDPVTAGEVLFVVETDKVETEVQAPESGTLRIVPNLPDGAIPVGQVVAYLVQPEEAAPQAKASLTGVASAGSAQPDTPQAVSGTISEARAPASSNRPPVSPAARRVAAELGIDWRQLAGSGPRGRIRVRDVKSAAEAQAQTRPPQSTITPVARRMSEALGLDVEVLTAQSPEQGITKAEVSGAVAAAAPPTMPGEERTVPLSTVRRIIGERMAQSAHTTAPVTLITEADATELVQLRDQLKTDRRYPAPSYNDVLIKLSAKALQEHPDLNTSLKDDQVIYHTAVHIGLAVDTDRGLLVPVVRDVHTKSLLQIATETMELIERTRQGKVESNELRGATFTITNLGTYEIDTFTPIINLPECAILGVGRLQPKMVVRNEQPCIRKMVTLSLTFDHRIVDGAPAARFLQRVKQFVEQPYLWLVE
jgi:pyruvate dehydrogenase E2 component (dihydrolipoamide acetyltransferase)